MAINFVPLSFVDFRSKIRFHHNHFRIHHLSGEEKLVDIEKIHLRNQNRKVVLEILKLRQPFYLQAPFIASFTSISLALIAFVSALWAGYFDDRKTSLEADIVELRAVQKELSVDIHSSQERLRIMGKLNNEIVRSAFFTEATYAIRELGGLREDVSPRLLCKQDKKKWVPNRRFKRETGLEKGQQAQTKHFYIMLIRRVEEKFRKVAEDSESLMQTLEKLEVLQGALKKDSAAEIALALGLTDLNASKYVIENISAQIMLTEEQYIQFCDTNGEALKEVAETVVGNRFLIAIGLTVVMSSIFGD